MNRRTLKPVFIALASFVVLFAGVGIFIVQSIQSDSHKTDTTTQQLSQSAVEKVSPATIPVAQQVIGGDLRVTGGVNIAGDISSSSLTSSSIVITPLSNTTPIAGQLYVTGNNALHYYDGANDTNLSSLNGSKNDITILKTQTTQLATRLDASAVRVITLQGQSGNITFTGTEGIAINGTSISNTGVTSFGGSTGAIAIGSGLSLVGGTLMNTGTANIVSGSSDITVTKDAGGTYTIGYAGSGTGGTVAIAPTVAQQDATNGPSVWINKTGVGNLLQLSAGSTPVDKFVVDKSGAILAGTIDFAQVTNKPNFVNSVNGSVGDLLLGSGLSMSGQSITNNGVLSVGGLNGAVTLGSGLAVTGGKLVATTSGVGSIAGTANQITATGTGSVVLSLPQDIATVSTPTFAGLNLTTALSVSNGGTGANTASGARTNLGAAASGANSDITSLSNISAISSTSGLTVGSTGQNLMLQGASTTLSSTAGGFTNQLAFATPTANVTYRLQNAAAGTYDVCTTAGNCVGAGGGVTTSGGTIGTLSKFISGSSIGDSIISDNGSTVSIAGTLSVNNITPTSAAIIGATTQSMTLQGSTTTVSSTNGASTNTLRFTTPSGSAKSIVIPNASGTVAVTASGALELDSSGNLTCPSCLTSGGGGGTAGVSSVNGSTGAITIASVTGSSIVSAGTTVTIQDASSTVKGLASFNATNFSVTSGAVNTIQGISPSASPTFNGLSLSNALGVASGGTGVTGAPANGQLLMGNGTGYTLGTLTAGAGISILNTAGAITLSASGSSGANQALSNLSGVALNTNLLPGTNNSIDLGSSSQAFRNSYLAGTLQAAVLNVTGAGLISGNLTTNGNTLLKTAVDSTSALQIQTSTGTNVLSVDTAGKSVNVGAAATYNTYSPSSSVSFTQKAGRATATNPLFVISADINGDNKPDLAVVNNSSNSISALLGNGDGTFPNANISSTGNGPTSVAAADFDGDGKVDLAVANGSASTVSVLIGYGTGGFQPKVDYTTGSIPKFVATADFNGDGKADIVTVNNSSNTVSVFLNKGDGTFNTKVDYVVGSQPSAATTADFNGDGKVDIVVANGNSSSVSVLIGNGNGTFAGKVDYSVGTTPNSVVAADFNGDSSIDLAVANKGTDTVSVLMGNGNGSFATKVDYATASQPNQIATADFNNDGKADLVTVDTASSSMSVFLGNGNGTFQNKLIVSGIGTSVYSVVAGDFNGDGKPDLAVSSSGSNTAFALLNSTMPITNIVTAGTSISAPTATQAGLLVQGAASQTADILRVQNATGDSLFNVAANGNIAMGGTVSDTYKLSVVGSVNATALYQGGNKVCDISNNCGAIKNGTTPQTANINISGNAIFGGDVTVTGKAAFSGSMISFSNNVRGYNIVVVASATSQVVTFGTAYPDANYAVLCTPSFNSTCYITNKTTTGFTINYGTSAPSDGSGRVDWFVLH